MSLIYTNIVPENNLRLPDALTIKHGPAPLLSRFVLEGDTACARPRGPAPADATISTNWFTSTSSEIAAAATGTGCRSMFDPRIYRPNAGEFVLALGRE